MAGRFPLYSDEDVRGPLIKSLRALGWDIVRAIDTFPKGSDDDVHFDEAVRLGRVLVANDEHQHLDALRRLAEGRRFPGLVYWPQRDYDRMSYGEISTFFEDLALRDDPFGNYPIVYVKPQR